MALRTMPGATRIVVKNCTFRSLGGDTVSPWDTEAGMYYFKDCTMEGAVDFYCPRGWAYAENCRFECHNLNAAIWHDGSGNRDEKTVLKNCTFVGDDGFKLGRFHREAQFYLIGCHFPQNMADADIYWAESGPGAKQWGRRVYYANCHRIGRRLRLDANQPGHRRGRAHRGRHHPGLDVWRPLEPCDGPAQHRPAAPPPCRTVPPKRCWCFSAKSVAGPRR